MNRDDIILTQQALVISVWFNNLSEYLNERQCNSEKKKLAEIWEGGWRVALVS